MGYNCGSLRVIPPGGRMKTDPSRLPTVDPQDPYTRRVRGCLLGGALGDAVGAPIEFAGLRTIRSELGPEGLRDLGVAYGRRGAITDDTQMTLFTAEGLIRAWVRGESRGIGSPPSVVRRAYLRWLHTQGTSWREAAGEFWDREHPEPDGWLVGERWLHSRRAPGNTCLGALEGRFDPAVNTSKGCGGVMRVAPVGLLPGPGTGGEPTPCEGIFRLGVEIAALTHGHPSGQLPAGVLAATLHGIVHQGQTLSRALDDAIDILRRHRAHEETLEALQAARSLAGRGKPTAEQVETLGGGWVAEEALAIAAYAALSRPDDLREAMLLAANHSGDSDSTASITGQLLGAVHGESALPADWLADLEGRETINRLADDFVLQMTGRAPMSEVAWGTDFTPEWYLRYPPS
ncbi:MAG: ADP-ribosylglycohydrolase family protein [Thermoanaerobaculia bacterium]|nr:MAG: ADP-ribosylglycohydrolase family protein [Thermoanaerobaculia bacterium]